MSPKWNQGDLNLDGYFACQVKSMLPFFNPQDIINPLIGDSKLPGHHQEDQESQECPPSRIKES